MNGTAILAELLTTPEGKTLEFKRDLSSLRPILKSLVAFANTAVGHWSSAAQMMVRSSAWTMCSQRRSAWPTPSPTGYGPR